MSFNLRASGTSLIIGASVVDSSLNALSGETLTAILQRQTDSFYWNNTTKLWQVGSVSFTVAGSGGKHSATLTPAYTVGVHEYFITYQQAGVFNFTEAPIDFVLDGQEILEDVGTVDTVVDAIKLKTDNLPDGVIKNVAFPNFKFLMIDGVDHFTPKVGLGAGVTVRLQKDAGSFAVLAVTVTEIGLGWYRVDFTADNMNADSIALAFSATGADTNNTFFKTDS